MRILHYSLGFPPYRSGGLTKFNMDLMNEQVRLRNEVALLWPGKMNFVKKNKLSIRHGNPVNGIKNFEIINPLPVPYDEGITDVREFMKSVDVNVYIDFLSSFKPDVVHIHTYMGLHKEFLEACQKLDIKTVFTVHDFYSICPRVKLVYNQNVCLEAESCIHCPKCNTSALSLKKIRLLQSPIYRKLKDNTFVKILRKRHRNEIQSNTEILEESKTSTTTSDYLMLRDYYRNMTNLIDLVHYNSSVTKNVFESFFKPNDSKIISITHSSIRNNKQIRKYSDKIHFGYLGPQSVEKGYYLLIKALDIVYESNKNIELHVYFSPVETRPYIISHEPYTYNQLGEVFNTFDILTVPSVWYETFGYTALESLSYGVPILISDHVGAKDILSDDSGLVFESNNLDSLVENISKINPILLSKLNNFICKNQYIPTIKELNNSIMSIYK